jgi:hypothetical protein
MYKSDAKVQKSMKHKIRWAIEQDVQEACQE